LSPTGYPTPPTELHVYGSGAVSPQVVTTNADSTFTVTDVLPPYDIVVPLGPKTHVFLGLTRSDPVVACYYDNYRTTTIPVDITVTFSSTGTITADTRHTLAIECAHARGHSFGTQNPVHITSMLGYMTASESCSVKAVEFNEKADGLPTSFGYGEMSTTVTPTGNPVSFTLPITSYAGQGTSVSLTAIDYTGSPATSLYVSWQQSRFDSASLSSASSVTVPIAAAAPAATAGLDLWLSAGADGSNWSVGCNKRLTNDASQTIQCPGPPSITSPLPNAVNVDASTPISVTPIANATYRYTIVLSPDSWEITTSATTFTAGDLGRFGLALPTDGRLIQIFENVYDNVPTMDAWAAGAGVDGYVSSIDGGGKRYVLIDAYVVSHP
jgi:hypothetical protein